MYIRHVCICLSAAWVFMVTVIDTEVLLFHPFTSSLRNGGVDFVIGQGRMGNIGVISNYSLSIFAISAKCI